MSRGYAIEAVPPVGDDTSTRFAIGVSPGGFSTRPGANVGLVFNHLVEKMILAAPGLAPEVKTIPMKRVIVNGEGQHVLIDTAPVTAVVTHETVRSGRFSKSSLTGGALVDDLLLSGPSLSSARDETVWDAVLEMCRAIGTSGEETRQISDSVQRALLIRAGVALPPDRLPR